MSIPSLGRTGVRYCDKIFRIEEKVQNPSSEERLQIRKEEALPVIMEFYAWLDTLEPAYKSQKDAITYAKNQK